MSAQYRNHDRPDAPQVVSIAFEMITERDDDASSPDERDECFWPESDDFEGDENAYLDAKGQAQERLDAWYADEWEYIGIKARAVISVPIGGGSFCRYALESAGLWGTESDSDDDYLRSIFEDECAELRRALEAMGLAALATSAAESAGFSAQQPLTLES